MRDNGVSSRGRRSRGTWLEGQELVDCRLEPAAASATLRHSNHPGRVLCLLHSIADRLEEAPWRDNHVLHSVTAGRPPNTPVVLFASST
jgi:hypothetical protein